ncbi:MAG: hypothetical protein IPJ74_09225 [Saprospiraceae bacterium]|nr:hypothetical protein [Saprospiraceae bacterium]
MSELRRWRHIQYIEADELNKLQQHNLALLLKYASDQIPFYKNLQTTSCEDSVIWLRSFPIMYKNLIRNYLDDLIEGDRNKLVCEKSSGSSGIQGEVYMTRKEQYDAIAAQTHLWEWSGYRLGDSMLQLGMTTNRSGIKKWKDYLLSVNYQQAFNINARRRQRHYNHSKENHQLFLVDMHLVYIATPYSQSRKALMIYHSSPLFHGEIKCFLITEV